MNAFSTRIFVGPIHDAKTLLALTHVLATLGILALDMETAELMVLMVVTPLGVLGQLALKRVELELT